MLFQAILPFFPVVAPETSFLNGIFRPDERCENIIRLEMKALKLVI